MKLLKLTNAIGRENPYYINSDCISSFFSDGTHTHILVTGGTGYEMVQGDITAQLAKILSAGDGDRLWTI